MLGTNESQPLVQSGAKSLPQLQVDLFALLIMGSSGAEFPGFIRQIDVTLAGTDEIR